MYYFWCRGQFHSWLWRRQFDTKFNLLWNSLFSSSRRTIEVERNFIEKNEKIWNLIINTDNAEHDKIQSSDKRKSQTSSWRKTQNQFPLGNYEGSVNDDLERFLINLQNKKEVKYEFVESFFTPKLTNEELKLVKEGNKEHLKTYWHHFCGRNPDVNVKKMKKSDSKSTVYLDTVGE